MSNQKISPGFNPADMPNYPDMPSQRELQRRKNRQIMWFFILFAALGLLSLYTHWQVLTA